MLAIKPTTSGISDGFGSTNWSLVLSATVEGDGGAALNQLCRRYWRPVYVFIRRSGLPPRDAEDATQEFFAYLLERSWLKNVAPEKGSFRAFIYALLRNFLANRRRTAAAQKRGGPNAVQTFSDVAEIHDLEALATAEIDPRIAYDRAWATTVSQAALSALAAEQERAGFAARFKALRGFLTHPPSSADYDRLVRELGEPRNRIAVAMHRLSHRYAELIRAEIIDTLVDRSNVETELRSLIAVLAQ